MKPYVVMLLLGFVCNITSPSGAFAPTAPHHPFNMSYDEIWEHSSQEMKDKYHTQALLTARMLMTEDRRTNPWIMMASIVKNRVDSCYRGDCTVYDVIHAPRQFTAIWQNHDNWKLYKNFNVGDSEEFDEAYHIAREIFVMGVPFEYSSITHAYHRGAMMNLYNQEYPFWDAPGNRMTERGEIDGWVYGAAP